MGRQAGTKQQRTRLSPDERRAQILGVTLDLIRTNPIDKVDAAMIGRAAGVSRSLVFHYFPSTRELHLAVLEQSANGLLEYITPKSDGEGTAGIAAGVRSFIDYVAVQPATFMMMSSFAATDAEFGLIFDRIRGLAVDLVRSTRVERPLSELQIDLLKGWIAMVERVTVEWIEAPSAPIDDVVAALVAVAAQIIDGGTGSGDLPDR